jgi:hypothetical protein
MPKGVYYDGDYFVASPVEGLQESNPFPTQPFTKVFTQKFQQLRVDPDTGRPVFRTLNLGTSPAQSGMKPAEPFNGNIKTGVGPFLVGESPRLDIGAGIVEWTRTWAHVPGIIYEFPGMNYQRQVYSVSTVPFNGYYDTWGNYHGIMKTFTAVEEWSEPMTGLVQRTFMRVPLTLKPTDMIARFKPLEPYRIIKFNDERGIEHVYQLGQQGIAEPTSVTQWMGDIYEIRNVFAQPVKMGALPSAGFSGFGLPPGVTINAQGLATSWITTAGGVGQGGVGGDFV